MNDFTDSVKYKSHRIWQYICSFFKWLLFSLVTGAIGGLVGVMFRICVDYVTGVRENNYYLFCLLPVGGLVIAFLYRITKLNGIGDTNLIITSVRSDKKLPLILAPVIFISTVITQLFGGSAGREGAALQLGGCIGNNIGKVFHLNEKDLHIATMCGMSGLFSALFGTPLTATVFAMEVISVGIFYYSAFFPCIVSALCAYGITWVFKLKEVSFSFDAVPNTDILSILKVSVLGISCAVVSIVFCLSLKYTHKYAVKFFKNEYLRIFVGGAVIVVLTLILGTRYNGTGISQINSAIENGECLPYDFILKIVFTAITIGFGYKGGEIIPTFFIGATLGSLLGPLLGLPAGFCAAVCLVAMFCGVVNCPIASLVLSVELFSSNGIVLFAVAICLSFMLSGYYGLYTGQKIMYSKRRARFVNRNTK